MGKETADSTPLSDLSNKTNFFETYILKDKIGVGSASQVYTAERIQQKTLSKLVNIF